MDSCFKPGDKPPRGYLEWHEWAAVQYAAGIRQKPCKKCGLYLTPQEVDDHMAQHFRDGIEVDALTANARVDRPDAALSRQVWSDDGLCGCAQEEK